MSDRAIFEIIAVGNELLNGRTLNTNSHWLAEKIAIIGGWMRRSVTVRDDVEDISLAIKEAWARRTGWLIICGGLGPTYDDKTLEGLSLAIRKPMELSSKALDMVKRKYEDMVRQGILEKVELTPPRLKMATIPQGAEPLHNSVGTAPGVYVKLNNTQIFALPGVPSEMKSIYEEGVEPIIRSRIKLFFTERITIKVRGIGESALAPFIKVAASVDPDVYVKSHPQDKEKGLLRIDIDITSTARSMEEAKNKSLRVARELERAILEAGGSVEPWR